MSTGKCIELKIAVHLQKICWPASPQTTACLINPSVFPHSFLVRLTAGTTETASQKCRSLAAASTKRATVVVHQYGSRGVTIYGNLRQFTKTLCNCNGSIVCTYTQVYLTKDYHSACSKNNVINQGVVTTIPAVLTPTTGNVDPILLCIL